MKKQQCSALMLLSGLFLATPTIASATNLVIDKLPNAKRLSSASYAYIPLDILIDTNKKQFKTLEGQYHVYAQKVDASEQISHTHYLTDVKQKLQNEGYTVPVFCLKDCNISPIRNAIEEGFRYNNLYKMKLSNVKKNRFGFLTAIKPIDGREQAITIVAQNNRSNDLLASYEQLTEIPLPSSGVKIAKNFVIEPLDYTSLKAPKKDTEGTSDHPLIERFPGSYLVGSAVTDFEAYPLIIGNYKKTIPTKKVEGKVTTVNYRIDKKVGPYAVYKNYMNALQQAGFTVLHSCKASTCGNMVLRDNLKNTVFAKNHKSDIYNMSKKSHYYLFTAEKKAPEGNIYTSLYSFQRRGSEEVELVVDIIEEREMSKVALNIDADTIGKQIQSTGSISLYGIEFDFDSHILKPSSSEQLSQIAAFLKQASNVSLYVVGHTDNKGAYSYNQDLSARRAAEVVKQLVNKYQISSSRLHPVGVGPVAPEAMNNTDQNRQKNRRVELVLKSPAHL
ncbi:DUF4892 domain-containing protein [Pseudoalteromonas carrageenovora]|uniref:OmpA family protein n=1 Tax=Pseudoalteromonas carrageenovora TaxID=227 RepID=UPI0031202148